MTADDDVYYPATWLEELLAAHLPEHVTAFRARIRTDGPYRQWALCTTTKASDTVFATGTSGVAYPEPVLQALRERSDEFTTVCPRADDFWLHYATIASGLKVRQVRNTAASNDQNLWMVLGEAA